MRGAARRCGSPGWRPLLNAWPSWALAPAPKADGACCGLIEATKGVMLVSGGGMQLAVHCNVLCLAGERQEAQRPGYCTVFVFGRMY